MDSLLDETVVRGILNEAGGPGLGTLLDRLRDDMERELIRLAAESSGIPMFSLQDVEPDPAYVLEIPRSVLEEECALPLALEEDVLVVALSDPTDTGRVARLRSASRRPIRPVLGAARDIRRLLREAYEPAPPALEQGDPTWKPFVWPLPGEERPAERIVERVIDGAIRRRATQVLVNRSGVTVLIRERIDGMLHEAPGWPVRAHDAVMMRLKSRFCLDLAETAMPQDGKMVVRPDDRSLEMRAVVAPTNRGECVTLSLEYMGGGLPFDRLGLPEEIAAGIRHVLGEGAGMILVAGPAQSGRGFLLDAIAEQAALGGRHVVQLGPSARRDLPGASRLIVRPWTGLTVPAMLRTARRMHAEVFQAELAFYESLEIAVQECHKGRLFLGRMDMSDAITALQRLLDLGLEVHELDAVLKLVISPRILPRLCAGCRKVAATGCEMCHGTGYAGTVAIYEMIEYTPALGRILKAGGSREDLAREARNQGLRPLREEALRLAEDGVVSREDALKIPVS